MPITPGPTVEALIRNQLRAATQRADDAQQEKIRAVAYARALGLQWDEICEAANISRPTAIRYAKTAASEGSSG